MKKVPGGVESRHGRQGLIDPWPPSKHAHTTHTHTHTPLSVLACALARCFLDSNGRHMHAWRPVARQARASCKRGGEGRACDWAGRDAHAKKRHRSARRRPRGAVVPEGTVTVEVLLSSESDWAQGAGVAWQGTKPAPTAPHHVIVFPNPPPR